MLPYGCMGDQIDFRQQAEECRQLAAEALTPDDKTFWLQLAADWQKLAQDADNPQAKRE